MTPLQQDPDQIDGVPTPWWEACLYAFALGIGMALANWIVLFVMRVMVDQL